MGSVISTSWAAGVLIGGAGFGVEVVGMSLEFRPPFFLVVGAASLALLFSSSFSDRVALVGGVEIYPESVLFTLPFLPAVSRFPLAFESSSACSFSLLSCLRSWSW